MSLVIAGFQIARTFIAKHPMQIGVTAVGGVLSLNPLGIIGFTAVAPSAGMLVAAWPATVSGHVAAGGLFATLQYAGIVFSSIIPWIGATVVALGGMGPWVVDTLTVLARR